LYLARNAESRWHTLARLRSFAAEHTHPSDPGAFMPNPQQLIRAACRRALAPSALAVQIAFAPFAVAKSADSGSEGAPSTDALQEVIVTARRSAENLQTTPISITALTAEDISQRGLNNVLDVAAGTPSLTLMPGGNYSGKSALTYIRGVGQDQFTFAFEPGVGFYVDDVYYGTVYGSIFGLADISNIQVLRGPQGTLFGKNNEGGAVLLYTPEPKGDDSGAVEVGYGSYHREFVKGSFDVPLLSDRLSLRVSGATNNTDGYVKRIDFACVNPALAGNLRPATTAAGCQVGTEGGENESSLRAALKWRATDNLTFVLRGELFDDRSEAGAVTTLVQNPPPPGSPTDLYNQLFALPMVGLAISSPAFTTQDPFKSYSSYTNPGTGYTVAPINHEFFRSLALTTEWDSPAGVRVKNIVAYQKYRSEFANTDGTPLPTFLEDNILTHRQFSEELQFSGKLFSDRLEWIAGGYYYGAFGIYGGHIELPTQIVVGPGVLPFAPAGAWGLNFDINDPTSEHTSSGFLHGVYHVTKALSVELGARYSTEQKDQFFNHTYTATVPLNVLLPPGSPAYPPGAGGSTSLSRTDPKLAIQYQWTPDLMTYVQVSTGYKTGGINPKPVLASDIVGFRPEHLTAYEIGLKSEWFNHHLMLDTAAYLSDYRDLQLSEFLPPPEGDGGTIVVNTGHARISGFELDLRAKPVAGLAIDASLSYLNYTTLSLGSAGGQVGGPTLTTRPPYVPRWKGSIGPQYTRSLGGAGSLIARVDWSYQSLVYFDLANTSAGAQPGYGLLNTRLQWDDAQGKWSAALEVRNATDKLYYGFKIPTLNGDGSLFNVIGTPGLPRTEFFTLSRRF
jgi:iron complex outermembrane receptor protein